MVTIKGSERVLVCPLGWGLGHATRVIPIIAQLLQKGCTVLLAGDEPTLSLLKIRFPQLQCIHFPSLTVKLSEKGHLFALIKIAIKLIFKTISENREIKGFIEKYRVDLIISDNRYGLYSKEIPSVLITHQLRIKFPKPFDWAEPMGEWYVRRYANRFADCWIPDSPKGFRLSGELSQPKRMPKNAHFIGLLSRFNQIKPAEQRDKWDLVVVVSGPPPHREIFERSAIDLANRLNLRTLVIQGLPQATAGSVKGKATLVPHLPDLEMANALLSAKHIVCRSGYSTLMDLMALNRRALLVPTPGQTEQEYLAEYLSAQNLFKCCSQNQLQAISEDDLERNLLQEINHSDVIFYPNHFEMEN